MWHEENLYGAGANLGDRAHIGVCRPRGTRVSNSAIPALKRWALLCCPAWRDGGFICRPCRAVEDSPLRQMATCLEMNGFTWNCGEVEETAMVLRAAAKEMQEDEWEPWVVRNAGKRTPQLGR